MKLKQKLIILAGIIPLCLSVSTSSMPAYAAACESSGIIPCPSGDGQTAIMGLLIMGINILTAGVGIAAVGGIVWAALLYTTAQDNAGQVSKSKMIITNVVIGIVSYFFMYAILNFIIPGGLLQ